MTPHTVCTARAASDMVATVLLCGTEDRDEKPGVPIRSFLCPLPCGIPGLYRLCCMYSHPPSQEALRTSPFARCDKGAATLCNRMPLHNANHSDVQFFKAANTTTDIFYHLVAAHQASPEMTAGCSKAYIAILTNDNGNQSSVQWCGKQEFRKT